MRLSHALAGTCAVVLAFGAAFQLGRPDEPQAAARVEATTIAIGRDVPAVPALRHHGALPALAKRPARSHPRKPHHARGAQPEPPAGNDAAPRPDATAPVPSEPAPAPGGQQRPSPPRPNPDRGGNSGGDSGAPEPNPPAAPVPTAVPRPPEELDPGTEDGEASEQ